MSDLSPAQQAAMQEWQQGQVQQFPPEGPPVPIPGQVPTASRLAALQKSMNPAERFMAGIGQGVTDVGRHAGNLVGLTSDADMAKAADADAPLMQDEWGKFGALAGQTLPMIPATMTGEGLLGMTGMGARMLARPALTGAAEGAGMGAVMGEPGQKIKSTLVGALTGAALPAAGGVANRVIQGAPRTAAAQTLLDRGVPLTPGQMSPGGSMNLLEQSAESVPVVGPLVRSSRENAEQEYGRAVIQQGAAPGTRVTPSENIADMYDQAAASWDPVYAQAHGFPISPQIMNQGANVPLSRAFQAASQMPGLTGARQRSINEWLQARLQGLPANPMSEDYIGANGVRSAIRQRQRQLLNSTDVDAPLMRNAYERAENSVTSALTSQLPPDVSQTLQNADRGYAQLKVIGNAVTRAGDQLSGMTPSKLSQAVRQATDSGAYARGAGGDLRDLAQAGTQVFQTVSPPTGARVLTAGAAGALGTMSPHVALPIMGAAGAGAFLGATTPMGRRLMAGQTAPQTAAQRLVGALRSNTQPWQRQIAGATGRAALNRAAPILQLPAPASGQQ